MPGKVGSNVWGARVVAEGGGKGVEEVHYIACCVAAAAGNGKYLNLIQSVHIRNTQFDSCWTGCLSGHGATLVHASQRS